MLDVPALQLQTSFERGVLDLLEVRLRYHPCGIVV
jgi:hypothetical protein